MSDGDRDNRPLAPTDRRTLLAGIGGLAAGTILAGRSDAGPLNPPFAPASTPGPEPRIAINAQNTPGDADSLYRITQPGSYYLTENVIGEKGKHGIEIAASDVTIDLMGYMVLGGESTLSGVITVGDVARTTIRNGAVQNWGANGIQLATSGSNLVERLHVANNASRGIEAGTNSVVKDCVAVGNGGYGIYATSGSIITRCSASQNSLGGFFASSSIIEACVARTNTSAGFFFGFDCQIRSNLALFNDSYGFGSIAGGSRIESNHSRFNGTGFYLSNSVNFLAQNTSGSNTTANWNIAAGNVCLVVSATTAAAINGNAGGTSLGSTDPNANYTY